MTARDSATAGRLTEGPMGAHVFRLAGVMIMGFLAMTLSELVQISYIALVGKEELAAIAFSFPLTMSLNALTRGIGVGASTIIAQALGARDREQAGTITTHCYLLTIVFTVIGGLVSLPLLSSIYELMGAEHRVLVLVTDYTAIWLLGFPLMGIAMVSNGLTRSFGDIAYSGYIMTAGPVVLVVLGPFLIFGWIGLPAMGLEGAAWAFVISALVQVGISADWFLRKERLLVPTLTGIFPSWRAILQVGIPAGATNLIQPLSGAIITWLLAGFGVAIVAGFGVASRIESVVSMVVIGISTSIVPIVGQNWGARQFDRVNEALRLCYAAAMIWGLLAAVSMWLGASWFTSLISSDPEVAEVAVAFLYIVPASIGFMGLLTISTHCFNALRKPMRALIISIVRLLALYIPLSVLASRWLGYVGIFYATALTNVIVGIAAVIWSRRTLQHERQRLTGETI